MEDLKNKFIVSDEVNEERLKQFIKRLLPFCKVTESGRVIIEESKLTTAEKIWIAIVARYMANQLDSKISSEMEVDDLRDCLLIPRNQVIARLKDLKDKKLIRSIRKGVYEADPTRIENFLREIETKHKERKSS